MVTRLRSRLQESPVIPVVLTLGRTGNSNPVAGFFFVPIDFFEHCIHGAADETIVIVAAPFPRIHGQVRGTLEAREHFFREEFVGQDAGRSTQSFAIIETANLPDCFQRLLSGCVIRRADDAAPESTRACGHLRDHLWAQGQGRPLRKIDPPWMPPSSNACLRVGAMRGHANRQSSGRRWPNFALWPRISKSPSTANHPARGRREEVSLITACRGPAEKPAHGYLEVWIVWFRSRSRARQSEPTARRNRLSG